MRYRRYGKGGPEVSALGFGVMRLPPRRQGDWNSVNFTRSTEVLRRALELGVNFLDSHHFYHGGRSEQAIGKALKGWKGQRVYVQTKAPISRPQPLSFFKKCLEEALEKLGVEPIDYLLFHSMREEKFKTRGKMFFRLTDWAIKRGYIRHRGFSSHDTPENVRKFIDTGEFSVMLVSYNFLKPDMRETIAYAASKGMGVAVMNPVGGGTLAAQTPQLRRLVRGARSAPEVALRYVLDTPGVSVALSGMNTLEMVEENCRVASRKTMLTAGQRREFRRRLRAADRQARLVCTACGYCMPCPHGVDIPGNFTALSQARLFGLIEAGRERFARMRRRRDGDRSALACKKCGKCLPKCPNDIPIIDQLAETAELLG